MKDINKDQTRTTKFVDADNNKWEIKAEITHRNNYNEFTMSGKSGQCQNSINPEGDSQKELIRIWEEWHLNGRSNHLPEDFWDNIETLFDDIESEEQEKFDSKPVSKCSEEELEEFDNNIIAIGLHLELTIEELNDITLQEYGWGNCLYEVQGEDYYSGDPEEINEATYEYIEETLWAFNSSFLSDYGVLDTMDYQDAEMVLQPLREQCENGNDAVKALVNWNDNKEEITEDAIGADGIGSFLNGYDGTSDEYDVSGITYTVCQG